MPETRARTSTSREPAVCAGYSNSTGDGRAASLPRRRPGSAACRRRRGPGMASRAARPQAARRRRKGASSADALRELEVKAGTWACTSWGLYRLLRGADNLHTDMYVCQPTPSESSGGEPQRWSAARRKKPWRRASAFSTRPRVVFHDKGVAHASLEEIARDAELTRGAIYWHFKDKAELFDAMMQRVALPVEEMLEAAGCCGGTRPAGGPAPRHRGRAAAHRARCARAARLRHRLPQVRIRGRRRGRARPPHREPAGMPEAPSRRHSAPASRAATCPRA